MTTRSSTPLFLSLDPEPGIASLVKRYKRRVRHAVGEQLYLNDPPHLTCYLAHFSDSRAVIAATSRFIADLAAPEINISGWHVFEGDQLTGNNTLVLDFDELTRHRLRQMQSQIIDAIAPLRDRTATREHFAPRWGALSVEQRCNVDDRGFPFCGVGWHPHFTIASIRPCDWQRASAELLAETPQVSGCCRGLTVFRLKGAEPVAVAAYTLRCDEVTA
ncbi:MAG: 2'-5' RNA ligase family protein [Pirellulales bacterium]|nr:2'-5' RNA ligase family protein [Pirellulales bacterium]